MQSKVNDLGVATSLIDKAATPTKVNYYSHDIMGKKNFKFQHVVKARWQI